jgi:hypothetical protein
MSSGDIVKLRLKDGSWINVEIVSTLLQDDWGEITEILGVSRDVTRKCALRRLYVKPTVSSVFC